MCCTISQTEMSFPVISKITGKKCYEKMSVLYQLNLKKPLIEVQLLY